MSTLAELPPHDITPLQMLLAADFIVKLTIAILVAASLATWTILLGKSVELLAARRRIRAALRVATEAATLDGYQASPTSRVVGAGALLAAATTELRVSDALPKTGTPPQSTADERLGSLPPGGIKERIAQRLQRVEVGLARRMSRGTGILATIGSCAPFVGLFGTVWGIMNSFVGISRMQTTNLAVVAPGIAEALLATAAGLVAAIPAVVIYNGFARATADYRALLADLSTAIWGLASRDLDRLGVPASLQARPEHDTGPARPVLVSRAAE